MALCETNHSFNKRHTCINCGLVLDEPIFSTQSRFQEKTVYGKQKPLKSLIVFSGDKMRLPVKKKQYWNYGLVYETIKDISNNYSLPIEYTEQFNKNAIYFLEKFIYKPFLFPNWFKKSKFKHIYLVYLAVRISNLFDIPK